MTMTDRARLEQALTDDVVIYAAETFKVWVGGAWTFESDRYRVSAARAVLVDALLAAPPQPLDVSMASFVAWLQARLVAETEPTRRAEQDAILAWIWSRSPLLAAQPQPSPEPCRVCRGNGVVPDPSHHSNDPMEHVACPSCRPSPEPPQLICGRTDPDDRVEALIRQIRADSPRSGPDDNSACGQPIELRWAFRCVECGRWFHRGCIEKHFAAHRQPSPEPKRKGWCNVCGFVGNDQAFVAHDCAEVSRLKNAGVPRAQE
jgi:hypothetical protein